MKTTNIGQQSSEDINAESWGLLGWLRETRIVLPLKGVEARFSVRGRLASVEIDQIYHQNSREVLDVTYTFPLPAGAAVYQCELHVNGRVIRAKIDDLEAARRTFAEKSAAGHRAALVESVRENLFELSLGNLAPGDTVVVRLAYFQSLEPAGNILALRLPFCPGIRYIPGKPLLRRNLGSGAADDTDEVPDASRISPPRLDALHPDAAYVSVEGMIHGCGTAVRSPSHSLVIREVENRAEIRLGDRAAVPDRDVVIEFDEWHDNTLHTSGWGAEEDGQTYAVVSFQAPQEASDSGIWAQDVYFLVDRSGSMAGIKWTATAKAFRAFLENLAPQDRAWVTFFESCFQDLAEKPLPPAALLSERIVRELERWEVGGGTELLPAAEHVLEQCAANSQGRNVAVVLITDGQVGDEAGILRLFRKHPNIRVHTFGIDTCVNDAFLKSLARQQRGRCHLANPQDDFASVIAALGAKLRRPVLTDLMLATPGWEWPAEAPADIFAMESLTLCARGPAGADRIAICGSAPDGSKQEFVLPLAASADPAISRLWFRGRIDHLLQNGNREAAVALAKRANLLCQGTAFVAWDEAEKVAVKTKRNIYQPSLEPGGWELRDQPMPAVMACYAPSAPRFAAHRASRKPSASFAPSRNKMDAGNEEAVVADMMELYAPSRVEEPSLDFFRPLIGRSKSVDWRSRLVAALPRLARKNANAWLDWLEQWALSDPAQQQAREAELVRLADIVVAMPNEHGKIAAIRTWAAAVLHGFPAFFKPVIRWLDEL